MNLNPHMNKCTALLTLASIMLVFGAFASTATATAGTYGNVAQHTSGTTLLARTSAAASAGHLPWPTISNSLSRVMQAEINGLARHYGCTGCAYRWQRVIARPSFGEYWMQIYGSIPGTQNYGGVTVPTEFFFVCQSWTDFRLNLGGSGYTVKSIPGQCKSWWTINPALCGGPLSGCIATGDPAGPPPGTSTKQWDWFRSWGYWPTILNPPF